MQWKLERFPMGIRGLFAVLCLLAMPLLSEAGKYNPTLEIGAKAARWENLPGADGKSYSLDDFKSADVLVIVFTCNSCPYAVDYEDRLIELAKRAATKDAKFKVVAVNVNLIKEDRLPAMKARAAEKHFNFPYLFDETQETAKAYGATFTPEFFVLNRERKLIYMGAMDDNTDAAKVKRRYVQEAIDASLAGKPVDVEETVAIGCRVRFQRKRGRSK